MEKGIKTSGILCFVTTAVVSVVMFGLSNTIYALNYQLLNPAHTRYWFVLLQSIVMIKYIASIIILMPQRILIKQAIYGLIAADVLIPIWTIAAKSAVLFPCYIIIGQLTLTIFYMFFKGRLKMSNKYNWGLNTGNKFTIETINA